MTEAVLTGRPQSTLAAPAALAASARLWFLVTAVGQWIFAAYIVALYGRLLAQGGIAGLKTSPLANGFIDGDAVGNAAVAAHLLMAVILMGGGPLQLIPQIRARFTTFHRWLGRTYILTAAASGAAGLYLIWTRPLFGSLLDNIGTSLDGVLILICAAMALRYAIARDIATHRRWALRLFMVTSSVLFLRVGVQVSIFFTGGVGIGFVWKFAQSLLPLAILELYLRARDGAQRRPAMAFGMAIGLFAMTMLMCIGTFQVTVKNWLPRF